MNPVQTSLALLRWTRFANDPQRTGGEKRSSQIRALCEVAGWTVSDMQPPSSTSRWRVHLAGFAERWRGGRHVSVDHAGVGLLGFRSNFYRASLAAHQGARVLLWETTYDSILPRLARKAGYRIVALPHNLESLVSEAAFADTSHDVLVDLAAEVDRLSLADAVFTISKEERWLLEARGLSPFYLPFYPDPALEKTCDQIRAARLRRGMDSGGTGPLLLVGSAFNPATERGMRWQLEHLRAGGWPEVGVVVIGPQTDTRFTDLAAPRLRLLGGVAREILTQHLAACSALLIHTCGGAGAVTRIPEALVAGVPVVANPNAARDQYGTPGVHIYEDPAGFRHLVDTSLPLPPPPPRPVAAEAHFQLEVKRLLASTHA